MAARMALLSIVTAAQLARVCIAATPVVQGDIGEASSDAIEIQVKSAGWEDGNFTKFWVNGEHVKLESGRGLNVVILNSEDGSVLESHVYDTGIDGKGAEPFAMLVNGLPTGAPVLIAVMDDAFENLTEGGKAALKSLGANQTDKIDYRSSYALIGVKGSSALAEKVSARSEGAIDVKVMLPITLTTTTSRAEASHTTTTSRAEASLTTQSQPRPEPSTSSSTSVSPNNPGNSSNTKNEADNGSVASFSVVRLMSLASLYVVFAHVQAAW